MPIPRPKEGEAKDKFLSRCMSDSVMVSEYKQDKRYAICQDAYENKNKSDGLIKVYSELQGF